MGYYIEVPSVKGKADLIVAGKAMVQVTGGSKFSPAARWETAPAYAAEKITRVPAWEDIPEGKALVCVVDNGIFEAAGVAYSSEEYGEFTRPEDPRPREYVLMDRDMAFRTAGVPERYR